MQTGCRFRPWLLGRTRLRDLGFETAAKRDQDSVTQSSAIYIFKAASSMLLKKRPHLGQHCTFFAVALPTDTDRHFELSKIAEILGFRRRESRSSEVKLAWAVAIPKTPDVATQLQSA